MRLAAMRTRAIWERARASAVAPIGLIVAAAIIAIVVAVLTSANRADEVAIDHEQRLIVNAIADRRAQVIRELENVVASDTGCRNVSGVEFRPGLDPCPDRTAAQDLFRA